jgi:leucyl-tRNA synthetase
MSKSKDNGVNPMNEIENYGADSLRMTICFMGPYDVLIHGILIL